MTVQFEPVQSARQQIPDFEGHEVLTTKAKLSSTAGLDVDNVVLKHDQVVRLIVEARVTGVAHQVNERSGALERVQTLKALEIVAVVTDC